MQVKNGSKVVVHYTGSLEDGTVFDSSEHHSPLTFTIGSGQVIKGFEDGLMGMKKGETKDLVLTPENSYGEPSPELIKKIPRAQLPLDKTPEAGMILALGTPDGQEFPATIQEVTEEYITLDLNHPLAGKTLHFKVTLVDIS